MLLNNDQKMMIKPLIAQQIMPSFELLNRNMLNFYMFTLYIKEVCMSIL